MLVNVSPDRFTNISCVMNLEPLDNRFSLVHASAFGPNFRFGPARFRFEPRFRTGPRQDYVGYVGGVNCDGSDSDDTEDWNDSGSESSSSFSELEGTDLENNLKELREEAKDLKGTMSSLERLHLPKSTSYWRKAESNRALGYTGTSQRTQRQRAKNARERAVSRDEARSS